MGKSAVTAALALAIAAVTVAVAGLAWFASGPVVPLRSRVDGLSLGGLDQSRALPAAQI